MPPSTKPLLAAPVVALLFALGCSFDAAPLTERQCTTNRDCAEFTNFMCFEGYCVFDPNAGDTDVPDVADDVAEEVSGCNDLDHDGVDGTRNCPTGTDCDDGNPAMYPGNTEVCDGLDNDCDTTVDNLSTGLCPLQSGVCAGAIWTCPAGIEPGSSASPMCDYGPDYVPAEEYCTNGTDLLGLCADAETNYDLAEGGAVLCDDLDNDCDGETDEHDVIACYDGARAELGFPATACEAGQATCDDLFAACVGQALPAATEDTDVLRCNAIDDDCDGAADEDCGCPTGTNRHCYTGTPLSTEDIGTCVGSTQDCVAGVWEQTCVGQIVPATETCANMGEDNNCDTVLDNINGETYGDPCFIATLDGPCRSGVKQCSALDATGTFGCQQTVFPAPETCNNRGADNDCDNVLSDIDFPDGLVHAIGEACTATGAVGECRNGAWACPVSGGDEPVCAPGPSVSDIPCNSLDEDCDGSDAQRTGTIADCNGCGDDCTGADAICCPITDAYECRNAAVCD